MINDDTIYDFASLHRRNVAVCFAENSIAHHVAETNSFKTMLSCIRSHYTALPEHSPIPVVSRKMIHDEQAAIANEMRGDILRKLNGRAVTVAIDGWTDVNKTKVTNVVLLSGGTAYYWAGIFNKSETNGGDYVAKKMIPILLQLRQEGVDIVALATDNEAAMVNTHTIISNYTINDTLPFNELIHIRCAAHTINLIVQELLIHSTVAPIIKDMKETIYFIRNNKMFRHKFLALQQDENKSPRILPIPCDTRWNSYYVVLAQFLAVKSCIMGVLVFASGAGKTRKLKRACD